MTDKEYKVVKVAWICSFSNEKIRARLPIERSRGIRILFKLMGVPYGKGTDSAVWNSNALEVFETIDDVDLHVICPVRGLAKRYVKFTEKGIHYFFFREQNSNVLRFALHHLFTRYTSRYKKNRRIIRSFIDDIRPDIVQVTGAENPFYSLSLLDVPSGIPTIIQLQTLLTRLVDETKVKEERKSFYYKGLLEREIINKADYIATISSEWRRYIIDYIKKQARFVDMTLAMAQKINLDPTQKVFDFVYYSANINKAGEEALESFILAHKMSPGITLDIIGGYDREFKEKLDGRIKDNGLTDAVSFEGLLPSHDDVIHQIRKARIALLPLKMDDVPNTVHEAMSNGLPVVTTVTYGTPLLNSKRKSVLLSEQNDFQTMADNMILLLNNEHLYAEIRNNAAMTQEERSSNKSIIAKWCETYRYLVYQ